MHFQLTKNKIFLRKGVLPPCNPHQGASPLDPHIISRCLDALNHLVTLTSTSFTMCIGAYVISMHREMEKKCIP